MNENAHIHFGAENWPIWGNLRATWGLKKMWVSQGLGKKTLEVISTERGLSLDEVLSRLKQRGIDAKPTDRLKDVANKMGKNPIEIFRIIEGEE